MHWPNLFSTDHTDLPTLAQRLRGRWRRRRRLRGYMYSLVAFVCGAIAVRATSVTPPTFSELVGEAQTIARATVTSVDSRWVDGPQGHVIKTYVTFAVDKALKGSPGKTMTLEFLGGTVGPDSLQVSGMPHFTAGQHEILFVQGNGVQFCPLVRFGHGRYHVRTDAQTQHQFVTRNDESPLSSVDEVQTPVEEQGTHALRGSSPALTPDEFEQAITQEVSRSAAQK